MSNPLFQQLTGGNQMQMQSNTGPFQRFNAVRQAMANPSLLIKQRFPDIPDQFMNNPEQILNYLMNTRGISNQQIQNLLQVIKGGYYG